MNSVHEIIAKIHNEWEIEPKKAIQRGMECPFPLQCSLNLKKQNLLTNTPSTFTKSIRGFLYSI